MCAAHTMIEPFTCRRHPFHPSEEFIHVRQFQSSCWNHVDYRLRGATSQVRHQLIGDVRKPKMRIKKEDGTNVRRRGTSVGGFYMMEARKLASTFQLFTLSYRTCDTARSRWVQSLCITKGSQGRGQTIWTGSAMELAYQPRPHPYRWGCSPDWSTYSSLHPKHERPTSEMRR